MRFSFEPRPGLSFSLISRISSYASFRRCWWIWLWGRYFLYYIAKHAFLYTLVFFVFDAQCFWSNANSRATLIENFQELTTESKWISTAYFSGMYSLSVFDISRRHYRFSIISLVYCHHFGALQKFHWHFKFHKEESHLISFDISFDSSYFHRACFSLVTY